MKGRARFWTGAVCAALLTTPNVASASGLLYRDLSTGRWKGIVAQGDVKAAGAFAGKKFTGFSAKAKAPIEAVAAGVCGASANVVAAFSAKFAGPAPHSGLFLYDGTTDSILDVVVEGGPDPIGGPGGKPWMASTRRSLSTRRRAWSM